MQAQKAGLWREVMTLTYGLMNYAIHIRSRCLARVKMVWLRVVNSVHIHAEGQKIERPKMSVV